MQLLPPSQGSQRWYGPSIICRAESSSGVHGDADEEALRWRKTYQLSGQGVRNRCSMHTDDGFDIATDIPKSMGGGNTAMQPVLLLLSALAGCETATANFVGAHDATSTISASCQPGLCCLKSLQSQTSRLRSDTLPD